MIFSHSNIDLSITAVHLIQNKANEFIGEAFVIFESSDDIELALESVIKHSNRIQNKQFKVFRSSREQFQIYCDTSTIKKLSSWVKDEQTNRLENMGEVFLLNNK